MDCGRCQGFRRMLWQMACSPARPAPAGVQEPPWLTAPWLWSPGPPGTPGRDSRCRHARSSRFHRCGWWRCLRCSTARRPLGCAVNVRSVRGGEALVAGEPTAVDALGYHHLFAATPRQVDQGLAFAQVLGAAGHVHGNGCVLRVNSSLSTRWVRMKRTGSYRSRRES